LSDRLDELERAANRIRVLVCEDSKTDREVLVRLLIHNEGIEVVAVAERGEDVIPYLERFDPDIVTLDINLPGKSGIEVIDEVMAKHPIPILVISGQAGDPSVAMEALAAGAVEIIAKPEIDSDDGFEAQAVRLGDLLRTLSKVKVIRHLRARLGGFGKYSAIEKARVEAIEPAVASPKKIVGLAASTGGPQALKAVLAELGPDFPAPVLVVQHIAKGFTGGFVEWLQTATSPEVRLAQDGEPLRAGVVYVGPEDYHMIVRGGTVILKPPDPKDKHCPSADKLFASMASEVGSGAVCVILTGMGNDGASGAMQAKAKGALVIVQDELSSVVYGMPRAALESGAATYVVSLGRMADAIRAAVSTDTEQALPESR